MFSLESFLPKSSSAVQYIINISYDDILKGDIYYFGNLNGGVIMDNKTIKTLFVIASAGLAIAGIIFLCISIFGDKSNNNSLIAALG